MERLGLIELDPGVEAGLKLTSAGQQLAVDYEAAIQKTKFFISYTDQTQIPFSVLDELAQVACPCLMPTLVAERNNACRVLLPQREPDRTDSTLWHSMLLIMDFARHQDNGNQPLELEDWRRALTCGCSADDRRFTPPVVRVPVWRRWKLYALDSLLVFSLESGLQGFLEVLFPHGSLWHSKLSSAIGNNTLHTARSLLQQATGLSLPDPFTEAVDTLSGLSPPMQRNLEDTLLTQLRDSNAAMRVAWAYLLFLHTLAIYRSWSDQEVYNDAYERYESLAHQDGDELSLCDTHSRETTPLSEHFWKVFVQRLVIQQQLRTRALRNKEVAWFSYSEEFHSYDWEASYTAKPYRAARFDIYLSFLHNLHVIERRGNKWHINPSAFSRLGI
jgi:hypothetical protein